MIIDSLLQTDFYKFSMAQAVLHQFPSTTVRYKFKSRGEQSLGYLAERVAKEIESLDKISFTGADIFYLSSLGLFTRDFLQFLRNFKFYSKYVCVSRDKDGQQRKDDLCIDVTGPWIQTIFYEIPILCIVSELHGNFVREKSGEGLDDISKKSMDRLNEKLKSMGNKKICFADFGTRRRFSYRNHYQVIKRIVEWDNETKMHRFLGTSNVLFAKHFGIKPIGTMAHEWLQAGQGMDVRLDHSQKFMLEAWLREYRGKLGIALTDVINMDAFLRDFDPILSNVYSGCRQDSGDPYEWAEKLIKHYTRLGINPRDKVAIFSDGLDFESMDKLFTKFSDKIGVQFGVGTNLTNDVGITPLKIVMKMVECNGVPVAKISDSEGKGMCEDWVFEQYLKKVYGLPCDLTVHPTA